jgi:hypothetical protein
MLNAGIIIVFMVSAELALIIAVMGSAILGRGRILLYVQVIAMAN